MTHPPTNEPASRPEFGPWGPLRRPAWGEPAPRLREPSLPVLRALAMILAHEPNDLGRVLVVAEAQRPGVTDVLVAAFEAEARHLVTLAEQAWAGADRLRAHLAAEDLGPDATAVADAPLTQET